MKNLIKKFNLWERECVRSRKWIIIVVWLVYGLVLGYNTGNYVLWLSIGIAIAYSQFDFSKKKNSLSRKNEKENEKNN